MIIVAATLTFETPADRDRAVTLSIPLQQATRDDEPGCFAYCFAPDPCVATDIQVYELWQDSPSLAAHFEHPNYQAMANLMRAERLVTSANRAYLAERDEPVYDEDGGRRTAFFE
jgi:quinol monooxygenase YgiN